MSIESPEVSIPTEAEFEQACDDAAGNSDYTRAHAIGLQALLASREQKPGEAEKSNAVLVDDDILRFAQEKGISTEIRAILRMQENYRKRIEEADSADEKRALEDHLRLIEQNNPELVVVANAVRQRFEETNQIN